MDSRNFDISEVKTLEVASLYSRETYDSRFALLSYSRTGNLGDEVQSIAASAFLPRIDALVDRDQLSLVELNQPHKVILNGWFSHRPDLWPPSPCLKPLFTSFHATSHISPDVNPSGVSFAEKLQEHSSIKYLQSLGRIGARDLHTRQLLCGLGVDAYFSGCLTLTLTPARNSVRLPFICINDLDDEVEEFVVRRTLRPIVRTTHTDTNCLVTEERMNSARRLLSIYSAAHLVITSRLHCALPCLALGTPVIFCPIAEDTYRFSGLLGLVRHTTRHDLLCGRAPINFEDPHPNPRRHLLLRQYLIRLCLSYINS